jgi:O-antigen ligase
MLQFWVLLYIAALYVRPGEIVPALADIPLIKYLSAGSGLAAILSLVLDPRKFWDQPHDKSILLYWMAITISNPAWGFFAGGPAAFTDFFPVIFCYFLIRLGIQTVPQVMRVTRLLVWLSVFLAANGLMQVFTGSGFGQVEAMETREGIRIMGTGIFNDPNDLGMALVMIVPFVLSATLRKGTKFFARVVSLAAMATLVSACYYTNSRGTILGLGSVFAAYVYRRYGPVTASVLATAGLVAILAFGPSRMSQVSSEEDSAQGRIQAWAAGMQMFRGSPVTGIGYRRFGDVHGLVAHNAFVHVLGELGFLGAMAFVGIFYWYFVRLPVDPEAPSTGARAWLRLDLADAGMGMLLCMCFLSRQYVVVPFILVAIGASYASAVQSGQQPPDDSAPARVMTIGMLTLALVIGFYIIARVFANY